MSLYLIEVPEFETVSQVAALITEASQVGCQPTMTIRRATPADLEDDL